MAAKSRSSEKVGAFLATVKPPQREIVKALRQMILETAPELTETVKWGMPAYTLRGNVVYIAPYSAHVNLGFYRGAELADSKGLLEGTGKGSRHVKVHSPEEARSNALKNLVRKAVALDRS